MPKPLTSRPSGLKLSHWLLTTALAMPFTATAADLCLFSTETAALGTHNSISATTALTTEAKAGIGCSAFQLSLLSGATFTATLKSSQNNLKLISADSVSGNTIAYQVYADKAYARPFATDYPMDYLQGGLLGLIFLGGGSASVPLYIRTTSGANLEAGTYTDTLIFNWDYHLCTGIGLLGLCLLSSWKTGSGTSQVHITLNVSNICLATAPDVSLGKHALIDQFRTTRQKATAQCTLNAPYQTYFDHGEHYQTPWRRMTKGGNDYLQYNLFHPNTTTPWLNSNPASAIGTGTVTDIPYDAAMNPAQNTPAAGAYADHVTFVITY